MISPISIQRRLLIGALACSSLSSKIFAQTSQSPIRFLVPFTPGSATDIVARIFAQELSTNLLRTIVVENHPGAGGTIAAGMVAKTPPDGNLFVVIATGHVVNPVLFKNLPYDTLKDFSAIAPLASYPNVLVVSPSMEIKSVQELITKAKKNPSAFNYATAGIGSASHINSQKFLSSTGIVALHIPMKGASDIVAETMSGRCQFSWAPLLSSIGAIKSGKLIALAVSSPQRSNILPDVPTIGEAGVPGAEFMLWTGLLGPAGLSNSVISKMNAEISRISQLPEVKSKLLNLGAETMVMSSSNFDKFIQKEYDVLGDVMKNANN